MSLLLWCIDFAPNGMVIKRNPVRKTIFNKTTKRQILTRL